MKSGNTTFARKPTYRKFIYWDPNSRIRGPLKIMQWDPTVLRGIDIRFGTKLLLEYKYVVIFELNIYLCMFQICSVGTHHFRRLGFWNWSPEQSNSGSKWCKKNENLGFGICETIW